MQTWRRTFTTSLARLNHSPAATATTPVLLRCAEVLHNSRQKPCGLEDQEIKLHGFIRSVRKQKRFAFAEVSDGTAVEAVQAILSPAQATELSTGAAVEISGIWKACPPGKEQSHELQVTAVNVVGKTDPETYPIQKKYQSPEFLRQIPHLRFRTPHNALLARFRSECLHQLGNSFRFAPNGGFVQVQPPVITSSDCEGAGETFTVVPRETLVTGLPDQEQDHFFRAPKYLSVSSQLHLEAYAAELGNVWTLSPVFRAEKSDTPRHLSEFYMLEAEVNFLSDLEALTNVVEDLLRDLTRRLYETPAAQEILSIKRDTNPDSQESDAPLDLRQRWLNLMDGPRWRRITYTAAIAALQEAVSQGKASFEYSPTWAGGLQLEHERYIVDTLNNGQPVFVTDYPKAVKPFYMAPSQTTTTTTIAEPEKETVACFDLLLPEVSEVAGGSIREHRLPELIQNMREHGLIKATNPTNTASDTASVTGESDSQVAEPTYPHLRCGENLGHLQWYADLRRWGTAPHGGFGLGFDRFLGYLTGVSSVRDIVAFPRYFGRADC
ncbi:asparagine--tRNA ligase SLM5 [Aspergillus lucknowensis]|uniref:asparagine--tRNA ligase n=1 Tax=Aspergillus lucknowensis TaxID=176173 RepID=A0ABR4LBE6_9EURO